MPEELTVEDFERDLNRLTQRDDCTAKIIASHIDIHYHHIADECVAIANKYKSLS